MKTCSIPDCGHCQANRRRRQNVKGHRFYLVPRSRTLQWEHLTVIQKPNSTGGPSVGKLSPTDSWRAEYPVLYEWMTLTSFSDGSGRETTTLLLTCDQGHFKCCVNDRAMKRKGWMSSDSLEKLLSDVETALGQDLMEWRADHWVGKKRN